MVTLIREGFFTKDILPKLQNSQGLSQAHSFFRLSVMNNGIMPVSQYFKADVNLLWFTVPRVGFLVLKDPDSLLTPPYVTQLPGVVGCNLIQLGCQEFRRVHGFHHFNMFTCPETIHPVVFSQLCTFYHQGKTSREFNQHGYNKHQNRIKFELILHILQFHKIQRKKQIQNKNLKQIMCWDKFGLVNITKPFVSQLILQRFLLGKQTKLKKKLLV